MEMNNQKIEKTEKEEEILNKISETGEIENNDLLTLITEEIGKINPMFGGFEELGALLGLPDEQFEFLGAFFLDELERSLNNSNEKLTLINLMTANGLTVKDISASCEEMAKQIDEKLEGVSQPKKDFLKSMMAIIVNNMGDAEGVSKRILQIPIVLEDGAIMPNYAHDGDAGLDVYSMIDVSVAPGETVLIPTGIKVAIPYGYELQVRNKSGIALKTKLRVANTPGTIDSGYRDEIGIIIENIEPKIKDIEYEFDKNGQSIIKSIEHGKSYFIEKGQKIAQLVLSEVPKAAFYEVEKLDKIGENRHGGFGSTGLKNEINGKD